MLKNKDFLQELLMTKRREEKSKSLLIRKRNKLMISKECLMKFNLSLKKS